MAEKQGQKGRVMREEMEPGFDYAQALAEAERCLLCYDAPCSKGCPAGTDPGSFIRKLRLQNLTGALRTIKRNNVLGGACAVLCPTAALCERECAATAIDRPIRIGKIQRFLVEHGRQTGFSPLSAPPADAQTHVQAHKGKVAVIGSGPAGLSCAAELAQAGYAVTVFEARERAGGVLAYGVPAYRFSDAFMEQELDDVRRLGVEFQCSHPIQGESAAEALLTQGFSAVFVGTGCWQAMRLDVAGAEGPGVFSSVDFLSEGREGLRRDDGGKALAGQLRGKTVAVLGGGSVAADCAGSALRRGAKDVYIVYRRSYTEMPAEED
ncbi:MAG: FAD-dependent oxidoreductase, partial [Deltaproteobacteria bacterium]|nr:FAD-dependent oxidoreductase [Deltaproteobacteria bacterium]